MGLGRLVDVDTSLDEFIPRMSLTPGPTWKGHGLLL
jgi:hypothetical protein